MNLRRLGLLPLTGTSVVLVVLVVLQSVNGKPQDAGTFDNVASQSIAVAGNIAEMAANNAMVSKTAGFEIPFVKVKSESEVGTGAALRDGDDDDDSSEEDRRKRSADFQAKELYLVGEELLLPLSLDRQPHIHRDKRSPCHTYGVGGGTGGSGGSGGDGGDDDIDAERRRRAYARKRKAAKSKKTGSRKKKLVSDDDDDNQVLERRKRQSEADDLNQTMQDKSNDFAQNAQRIAEKIRSTFDSLVTTMIEMTQKLKQHFSAPNATNITEI